MEVAFEIPFNLSFIPKVGVSTFGVNIKTSKTYDFNFTTRN